MKPIRADSEAGPSAECQPPTGKDTIPAHSAHVGRAGSVADSDSPATTQQKKKSIKIVPTPPTPRKHPEQNNLFRYLSPIYFQDLRS